MTRGQDHPSANIRKHLAGVHYPADKEALEEAAHDSGAPPDVLDEIRALPDEEYGGPQEVLKAWAYVRGVDEDEEAESGATA